MSRVTKLITSLIIICIVSHLPESEAKASDIADNFISAAIHSNDALTDSEDAECTGLYTIFSPCNTFHLNSSDLHGDGTLDKCDMSPRDQSLLDDPYQTLTWKKDSELPQVGFLIPILHF